MARQPEVITVDTPNGPVRVNKGEEHLWRREEPTAAKKAPAKKKSTRKKAAAKKSKK